MLEKRIRELEGREGRVAAIRQSLAQLAGDLGYWLNEFTHRRGSRTDCFWRPDSWYRWLSLSDADEVARELTQKLEMSR